MAQINTDLEILKTARDNMKTALEEKGQTVTKDIRTYAAAISNIPTGGDVKLFDTVEEMQQDTAAQEGDLAVVYREEIQSVTEESEFDSCIFPNTVILDTAFSDSIYGSFRSTGSGWFDGRVELSSSNFRFNGYGDKNVRITYTSSDGITYTRTDGGEELQEFGTTIKWEIDYGEFNSVIGNFMKIGGNYFGGLYKYKLDYPHTDIFVPVSGFTYIDNNIKPINTNLQVNITNTELFNKAIQASKDYEGVTGSNIGMIFCNNDFSHIYIYTMNKFNMGFGTILFDKYGTLYFNVGAYKGQTITDTITGYDYDINSETVSPITLNQTPYSTSTFDCIAYSNIVGNLIGSFSSNKFDTNYIDIIYREDITDGTNIKNLERFVNVLKTDEYVVTKSQLNAIPSYVYEKTFYGKDGVESGTITEDISSDFSDINAEIYNKIQKYYDTLPIRVMTDDDKTIDINIVVFPTKSDGTSLIDTSSITNMSNMFNNCQHLTSLPLIDTSNVTNMGSAFRGCYKLTELPQIDTSNVTNMSNMLAYCKSLKTIPQIDTSNVTNVTQMFMSCQSLETIPVIDLSKVTSTVQMFNYCRSLKTIPLLDTSNVNGSMGSMFNECSSLETIPLLDTSKVTNMSQMFSGCTSLTSIPLLDTSSVTNMNSIFKNCSSLTSLPTFNTTNVGDMYNMVRGCTSLTVFPQLNTSEVYNIGYMFADCSSLVSIPQLDTSNVSSSLYNTFRGCTSLNNTSLNNILAMCKNATKITSNKTLAYIGLTQDQATICQSLSNYSAFTSAGWTTGY